MRISKTAAVAFGIIAISASALAQPASYAPPATMAGQPVTIVEKKDSDDMLAFALLAAIDGATLGLVATQNNNNGTVINVGTNPASD